MPLTISKIARAINLRDFATRNRRLKRIIIILDIFVEEEKKRKEECERTNRDRRGGRFNSRNCTLNLRYTPNRVTRSRNRGTDLGSHVGSAQHFLKCRTSGPWPRRAREIYSQIELTFGQFLPI